MSTCKNTHKLFINKIFIPTHNLINYESTHHHHQLNKFLIWILNLKCKYKKGNLLSKSHD